MSERSSQPYSKRSLATRLAGTVLLLLTMLGCDLMESPTPRTKSASTALQAARAAAAVDSAKAHDDSLVALRKTDSTRAATARKTWLTDSGAASKSLVALAVLRSKDSVAIGKTRTADSIVKAKHNISDSVKYAKDSIAGAKTLAAVVASYAKKMAKDTAAYEKAKASGETRYTKNLAALEKVQYTKYEALIEKNEAAIAAAQDLINSQTSTTSDKVKAAQAAKLAKAQAALLKTQATKEKAIAAAQAKVTKDSLASEVALAKLAVKMAATPVALAVRYTKDSLAIAAKLAKDVLKWTTRASDDQAKLVKNEVAKTAKWAKDTLDMATANAALQAKKTLDSLAIARADSMLVVSQGVVTFSPVGGALSSPTNITLASTYTSGADAVIYYTTDGSTPTEESTPYSGEISIDAGMVVKAIAAQLGYANTPVSGALYTMGTTETPTFLPEAGTYTGTQFVQVSTTDDAVLYYTLNGSTPTKASASIASGATVLVDSTSTLKVLAVRSGKAPAAVASAAYSIQVPPPIMTPGIDTVAINSMIISVTSEDPLAVIHYTMDGTTPSASSPIIASGSTITLKATRTIKAICTRYHFANSTVVIVNDTIQAAAPTFSLPAGEIDTVTASTTITTTTDGSVIYYSFDDTIPTPSAHLYTGPIRLLSQTTLRAIAVRANMKTSEESAADYTVPAEVSPEVEVVVPQ